MRGLKQRTTPIDEFVATCSVCGAALRHVHVLRGRSGPRCSFCGSPLMSAAANGRAPRTAVEEEGPLGLLTDFDRPRRVAPRALVAVSVMILIAVAAAAFIRERGRNEGLATLPDPTTETAAAPRDGAAPADTPRTFDQVRVAVEVTDPTWLEAAADGEVVGSDTFPAGERLTFRGDEEVTLLFYDAGGLRIRAGGRDITTQRNGIRAEVRLWLEDGRIRVQRTYG